MTEPMDLHMTDEDTQDEYILRQIKPMQPDKEDDYESEFLDDSEEY